MMIPVSLTIQGIYSYQEKQTIDFTRLTNAGIFGIFGPVGSGKSTILEAITFALYGRTDRLNLSGDNRNYNMMNLKSNEMLIDFVFKAGPELCEYKAQVKSRRNSRQFDDVRSCERTAYQKNGPQWIPVELEKLEEVLGLSYENFKRTIIIPQGKFQEFLLLGSRERTLMMKELFNLDRFELYYKVASIESKTALHKQHLEGQLQQLGEISKDQITAAEEALTAVSGEIEQFTAGIVKLQGEELRLSKLKEVAAKIDMYTAQKAVLKQQEPEISALEKRLAGFEYCVVHFKALIHSLEVTTGNILGLKETAAKDSLLLGSIREKLHSLESGFEMVRQEYENREILKHRAEELKRIVKILDHTDRHRNFLIRVEKGERMVAETNSKIEALKQKCEQIALQIKTQKTNIPDIGRLSKAKEWFAVNSLLHKNNAETEAEIGQINKEMDDLAYRKAALLNSDYFTGVSPDNSYDAIIAQMEHKKQTHRNAIEVLVLERQHHQVQQKLEEYATTLEDGKPCPLCGSFSHPNKFNARNISESIVKTGIEIQNHEKTLNDIEAGVKKLTEINTTLCLKEDTLLRLNTKKEQSRVQHLSHQELFVWNDLKDEQHLAVLFGEAEKIQSEIAALEKELENTRLLLEKEGNQKELYSKTLEELNKNALLELASARTLSEQLTSCKADDYAGKDPELIEKGTGLLLKQYESIGEKYNRFLDQQMQLRKEQDILLGRIDSGSKALAKEQESLEALQIKLETELKNSMFTDIGQVQEILKNKFNLEQERQKVNSFRQELDFVIRQLDILQSEKQDQQFDPEKYNQIREELIQLSETVNQKNQLKGQLATSVSKMKADLEAREALMLELSRINNRIDDIKTLKQLFKGNGFVKYISSVYLRELVNSANDRFYKLSGQKLSLELNADNDFEIRDYLNGGKLRNVKTLSGGQTFQAALSLALALSDNTRKLNGAGENFFFLDEGFGSLDKESLRTVFETLKSLRHENRVVGLISHVEEMNQEIDIHLRVTNHEDKGSIIEKSWD